MVLDWEKKKSVSLQNPPKTQIHKIRFGFFVLAMSTPSPLQPPQETAVHPLVAQSPSLPVQSNNGQSSVHLRPAFARDLDPRAGGPAAVGTMPSLPTRPANGWGVRILTGVKLSGSDLRSEHFIPNQVWNPVQQPVASFPSGNLMGPQHFRPPIDPRAGVPGTVPGARFDAYGPMIPGGPFGPRRPPLPHRPLVNSQPNPDAQPIPGFGFESGPPQ